MAAIDENPTGVAPFYSTYDLYEASKTSATAGTVLPSGCFEDETIRIPARDGLCIPSSEGGMQHPLRQTDELIFKDRVVVIRTALFGIGPTCRGFPWCRPK